MNSIQLQYFLAAAKFENFTKAAETLYISQPVLGRQISNLEKELGFPLFERSRKTVRLTKYGRMFEIFARETAERYETMARTIQEELRQNSMTLKIGSVEGQLLENYFGPALKYAVEHYPNLHISVNYYPNSVKMFDAMNVGEIDASIAGDLGIATLQTPVEYKQIGVIRCCFAVPASLPLAQRRTPPRRTFMPCALSSAARRTAGPPGGCSWKSQRSTASRILSRCRISPPSPRWSDPGWA